MGLREIHRQAQRRINVPCRLPAYSSKKSLTQEHKIFGFLKSDGKKIYIFRFLNPCKYCLVDVSIFFNPVFGKTYILHSLLKTIPDAEVEIKVIDDEGHEFKVHDYLKNYSNIIKELLKIENTLTYSR